MPPPAAPPPPGQRTLDLRTISAAELRQAAAATCTRDLFTELLPHPPGACGCTVRQ